MVIKESCDPTLRWNLVMRVRFTKIVEINIPDKEVEAWFRENLEAKNFIGLERFVEKSEEIGHISLVQTKFQEIKETQ